MQNVTRAMLRQFRALVDNISRTKPKNRHNKNGTVTMEQVERTIVTAYPNGHFYSPVVDPEEIRLGAAKTWPEEITSISGIDLNSPSHEYILEKLFPKYYPEFDYPEHGEEDDVLKSFYIQNSQFSWLDARSLFVLLREWKPKRIIEVGSGYSTALMNDVNLRFLNKLSSITAIEPFPRPFLRSLETIKLIEEKVQHVSFDVFDELERGDILFIDSSHVSKTGSDV